MRSVSVELELRLDPGRLVRTGLSEAVYGPGKTPQQCAAAVVGLLADGAGPVLLTRADPRQQVAAVAAAPAPVSRPPPTARRC